ncbi:Leucine Rich repeat, putative [Trypanosoma equiperdum]|uniref:Leucine Rich repeat, putative n=1 Tax=Trypanosoma equiperdum TaxID=5694 RepID=A0A1G4HZQ2_TRYEQ|nr:Leucine Rich repeat, putative [Trypanosoma equiperdum]
MTDVAEGHQSYANAFISEGDRTSAVRYLDLFLRLYEEYCDVAEVEANSRVLQAATVMQSNSHAPDLLSYVVSAAALGIGGTRALAPALASLPLKVLNLSECYLGDAGLRVLAETLGASSHSTGGLRVLELRGISASDGSSVALLVTALRSLQLLDVSSNRFGTRPPGFALLCAAMGYHPALREVHIADNMVSGCCESCVGAIAEWLVKASRACMLQHVDLRFNTLGLYRRGLYNTVVDGKEVQCTLYGFYPLVDALLLNNSIEVLEVGNNGFPPGVLDAIEAKLAVNKRTKKALQEYYTNHIDR